MAKATKAQAKRLNYLRSEACMLQLAVFDSGGNGRTNVPFQDCRVLASQKLVDAYDAAMDALRAYEAELVASGRAWRNSLGTCTLNHI